MDQLMKLLLHGENEISWYQTLPPVSLSAFQPYSMTPRVETAGCNNAGNMNRRMIAFLRMNVRVSTTAADDKRRNLKHKLNERLRREEKNCYFALYSMLPPGTKVQGIDLLRSRKTDRMLNECWVFDGIQKSCVFERFLGIFSWQNDKKSIVQMASMRVQELELVKKDLERKNKELQAKNEGNKIRVRIDDPTYGIDSLIEALKCLKTLDSKPRMIRSNFTNQEFLAVLDTATEVRPRIQAGGKVFTSEE